MDYCPLCAMLRLGSWIVQTEYVPYEELFAVMETAYGTT